MPQLTPVRADIDHPGKPKRYSSSLRLWHWLNAVLITGSLLTVLVNSTVLKAKTATPLVISALADKKVAINDDQARSVVRNLRDQVWLWHTYIGYVVAALFLFRLILEFFQVVDQKLIHKIRKAYQQFFITKQQRELAGHEFWVKTLYAIFYLLLFITVVTGLDLAFEDRITVLRNFHFMKDIHELNMYFILVFIIIHLAGVFLAERRDKDKGIISDMINGGNN